MNNTNVLDANNSRFLDHFGIAFQDHFEIVLLIVCGVFGLIWLVYWLAFKPVEATTSNGYRRFVANSSIYFFIFLALLIFRTSIVQTYRIEKNLTAPLKHGDHVLVSKLRYQLRLPVIGAPLMHFEEPQRGELVIYRSAPAQTAYGRIMGLPGESVIINLQTGKIFVDGNLIPNQLKISAQQDKQQEFYVEEDFYLIVTDELNEDFLHRPTMVHRNHIYGHINYRLMSQNWSLNDAGRLYHSERDEN